MSTHLQCNPVEVFVTKSLHKLVNQVAGNLRSSAVKRHSFIINEVSTAFQIESNESILATLLNQLLSTVVYNSNQSCIRIDAFEYDDVIFVTVKDNSCLMNDAPAPDFDAIKTLARRMNGTISINSDESRINSIILSFPNLKVAA